MGWRNKVLVVLIVYFIGFATAIYALAPVSTQAAGPTVPNSRSQSFSHSLLKSDEFALKFNSGMRTCLKAGSDAAMRTGEFIKGKVASSKDTSKNMVSQ
ncbi:MAG: hypothetical protein Q7T18_05380 [Sedimentisphaerales bacterium]|nr:hypothetical protein [Sedimentisphaerales bacterium]